MVRVHPGREKISFYGTLNLLTGQEIAMPSSVMNGEATAEHLQQILDSYPDVPIILLWDRAPWHFGAPLRELLEAHPRLRGALQSSSISRWPHPIPIHKNMCGKQLDVLSATITLLRGYLI